MYTELFQHILKISNTVEQLYEEIESVRERIPKEYLELFERIKGELWRMLNELMLLKGYTNRVINRVEEIFDTILSQEFLNETVERCVDYLERLYMEFEIDEDEYEKLIRDLEKLLRTEVKKLLRRLIEIRTELGTKSPHLGIPLGVAIENTIATIIRRRKIPPKRKRMDFGVLDSTKDKLTRDNIEKFIKKYECGIIAMCQDMKEEALQVLDVFKDKIGYSTYSDSTTQKLILAFRWK